MKNLVVGAVIALTAMHASAQNACTNPFIESTCDIPDPVNPVMDPVCVWSATSCTECVEGLEEYFACWEQQAPETNIEIEKRTYESPCCYKRTVIVTCRTVRDCASAGWACQSYGFSDLFPCSYSLLPPFNPICDADGPRPCTSCCESTVVGIPIIQTYKTWTLDGQCPDAGSGSCFQ